MTLLQHRAASRVSTLVSMVAVFAGCALDSLEDAGPAPTRTRAQVSASAGSLDPSELFASIRGVSFPDKGCVGSETSVTIASSLKTAAVGFDSFDAAAPCSVAVELDIPAGFRLVAPVITWQGLLPGNQENTPWWPSDMGTPPDVDGFLEGTFSLSSESCSEDSTRVTLLAKLNPVAPGTKATALHIGTEWRAGAKWQECQGNAVSAKPGLAGDDCGGPQDLKCAQDLWCDFDSVGNRGTCVDPHERPAAAGLRELCGGIRGVQCQAGLSCWWPTRAARDRGENGECAENEGSADAQCLLGVPELPCAAGLSCKLWDHRCVAADGSNGSACGTGLPACQAGLVCPDDFKKPDGSYYDVCQVPTVGKPCGPDNPCTRKGYQCWPFEGQCRIGTGADYSPCGGDLPACAEGLECSTSNGRCSLPVAADPPTADAPPADESWADAPWAP